VVNHRDHIIIILSPEHNLSLRISQIEQRAQGWRQGDAMAALRAETAEDPHDQGNGKVDRA